MELTQADYDERKNRVNAGSGDDEDARLVKHYEDNGFELTPRESGTEVDSVAIDRPAKAEPTESDDATAKRGRGRSN